MSQVLIDDYKQATADYTRLKNEANAAGRKRASILSQLAATGMSYREIATAIGLSTARTQQLIGEGKKANGIPKGRIAKPKTVKPAKAVGKGKPAVKAGPAKKTAARKPLPPKTTKKTV